MTSPQKVHGADGSHHNAEPDFKKAKKAGLLWFYNKVLEGTTVIDKTYGPRRIKAAEAKVPYGGYHFARPDADARDAKAEANAFVKLLNPKAGDLVPVLDFEVKHAKAEAWSKQFMAEVERLLKVKGLKGKPMHYGPNDFGSNYPYLRWVPRYNPGNELKGKLAKPAIKWDIWQFSNGELGAPNHFPGLPGKYDLNTMRPGLSVSDFTLTKAVTAKTQRVHVMHCSMQFSDPTAQKVADVKAIFTRAKKRGVAWITGTEGGAGSEDLIDTLRKQAPTFGYRIWTHPATDAWIAVSKDYIDGGWDGYWGGTIIPGKAKDHTAKGVLAVSFNNKKLGKITVIAAHYLTKGRPGDPNPEYRQHVAENKKLAEAIGAYAKKMGKGSNKVFYGGDQNIVDRTSDTFFGMPLTSLWDELQKWENTGHGNIDVIASYDADTAVTGAYCRALDDTKFFLNTDHYAVEGGFDVVELKAAA